MDLEEERKLLEKAIAGLEVAVTSFSAMVEGYPSGTLSSRRPHLTAAAGRTMQILIEMKAYRDGLEPDWTFQFQRLPLRKPLNPGYGLVKED